MVRAKKTGTPPTLAEAKKKLIMSLEEASPAKAIRERPLRSVALAAATGALLGAAASAQTFVPFLKVLNFFANSLEHK